MSTTKRKNVSGEDLIVMPLAERQAPSVRWREGVDFGPVSQGDMALIAKVMSARGEDFDLTGFYLDDDE